MSLVTCWLCLRYSILTKKLTRKPLMNIVGVPWSRQSQHTAQCVFRFESEKGHWKPKNQKRCWYNMGSPPLLMWVWPAFDSACFWLPMSRFTTLFGGSAGHGGASAHALVYRNHYLRYPTFFYSKRRAALKQKGPKRALLYILHKP